MQQSVQHTELPPVGYKLVQRTRTDGAHESFLVKRYGFDDEGDTSFSSIFFGCLLIIFLAYVGGCYNPKQPTATASPQKSEMNAPYRQSNPNAR